MKTLFPLGIIVATRGALAACEARGERPVIFLLRHAAGDFGDLSREDMLANAQSLKDGHPAAVCLSPERRNQDLDHHGVGQEQFNDAATG
jgi:hypothetical protein